MVCKNALDGLVTLGSQKIVAKLESIRKQYEALWPYRVCWIDEAIE